MQHYVIQFLQTWIEADAPNLVELQQKAKKLVKQHNLKGTTYRIFEIKTQTLIKEDIVRN